jgi:hypothetical protein
VPGTPIDFFPHRTEQAKKTQSCVNRVIKSGSLADFKVMEQEANTAVKKKTTAKETFSPARRTFRSCY